MRCIQIRDWGESHWSTETTPDGEVWPEVAREDQEEGVAWRPRVPWGGVAQAGVVHSIQQSSSWDGVYHDRVLMPGIPASKKMRCLCVNSSFSLLNTNCTCTKHDLFTVLSCIINICKGRDGCVESLADYFRVYKGQTLKLFHLELMKLLRLLQMRYFIFLLLTEEEAAWLSG